MNEAIREKRLLKSATNITNKLILSKISTAEYGLNVLSMDALAVRDIVKNYLKEHPHQPFNVVVRDGCLYFNEEFYGRIVPAPMNSSVFSEKADYYEGAILARQGM